MALQPTEHPPTTQQCGAATSDAERLIDFLRDRDVPCPLCGYNLRNLTGTVCPECRQNLQITVGVRDVRFGYFLATVAPGIFSGIAAVILAVPMIVSLVAASGGRPPWQIFAVDAFGFASGITAVVLITRRRQFIRLRSSTQQRWAVFAWLVHIVALLLFLISIFS